MLARRLPTILPAMRLAEAFETTCIHRVAGRTGARTACVTTRPCRAPHHTISEVGLIGGRQVPIPGDGSLAPHGMRLLDELPATRILPPCPRGLRQPLEKRCTNKESPVPAQPRSPVFSGRADQESNS